MSVFKRTAAVALAASAVLFVGCGKKAASEGTPSKSGSMSRSETLVVGGWAWADPSSFNPFNDSPSWPATGNVNLVYESLFGFDMLTGKNEPILGKEYTKNDSTILVTVNDQAKWSDNTPVTNDDVIATFYFNKKYGSLYAGAWEYMDTLYSNEAGQLVFSLGGKIYNPLMVEDAISSTPILSKTFLAKLEADAQATITDAKPSDDDEYKGKVFSAIQAVVLDTGVITSGPYSIKSYSPEKIVLERRDAYWGNAAMYGGKLPAPKFIIHPIYKGNDKYSLAIQQGDMDVSSCFMPEIASKLNSGVGVWMNEKPYQIAASIASLIPNCEKPFLKDASFRKAMAAAIDYDKIRRIAMKEQAPDLKPGLVIPGLTEEKYYNDADAKQYGTLFDTTKARAILKEAGFTWGADGMIAKDGKAVPEFKVTCPAGYTDWEDAIKVAVEGMRSVGIPAREDFCEEGAFWDNMPMGMFDVIMYNPSDVPSTSQPFGRFNTYMSSAQYAPIGTAVWENVGRYKNPKADSMLQAFPKLKDEAQIVKAYRDLNVLFMQELPSIPVTLRPWQFYEFSTKHWDNFPTKANPYAAPQGLQVAAGVKALWQIKAK